MRYRPSDKKKASSREVSAFDKDSRLGKKSAESPRAPAHKHISGVEVTNDSSNATVGETFALRAILALADKNPPRWRFLRPKDMLILEFAFTNLTLQQTDLQVWNKKMRRDKESKPAYITMYFPPQNIAERAFYKTSTDICGKPFDSGDMPVNKETIKRLKAKYIQSCMESRKRTIISAVASAFECLAQWQKYFSSQYDTVTINDAELFRCKTDVVSPDSSMLVPTRISGESRLVFKVPDNIKEFDLTLDSILGVCRMSSQVVSARALPRPDILDVSDNLLMRIKPILTPDEFTLLKNKNVVELSDKTKNALRRLLNQDERARLGLFKFHPEPRMDVVEYIGPSLRPDELKEMETCIESPYRLFLSPNSHAAWAFSLEPVTHDGWTELWHARLGVRVEGKDGPLVAENWRYHRTMRALWTPAYTESEKDHANSGKPLHFDPSKPSDTTSLPFRTSLDERDRYEIVKLTGDPSMYYDKSNPKWADEYRKRVIEVDRFMLSSLGAWMNVRYGDAVPIGKRLTVEEWRHISTMARDHYVRVVYKGYLFPFGHRASLIKITERKFHNDQPGNPAILRQRMFIVVRNPLKDYADDQTKVDLGLLYKGRELPFKRIRIITTVTPDLDDPTTSGLEINGTLQGQSLFWPQVNSEKYQFNLIGEDWDNNEIEFSAPLIFLANDVAFDEETITNVIEKYNNDFNGERKSLLRGQRVSIVTPRAPGEGDTEVEVVDLTFSAYLPGNIGRVSSEIFEINDQPLFYPKMESANVYVPAVKEISEAAMLKYNNNYLNYEFAADKNIGEVFAGILGEMKVSFSDKSSSNNAGGLITPNMKVMGLSRLLGPVGGSLDNVISGKFIPSDIFSAYDPKLIGGIKLSEILYDVDDFSKDLEQVPVMLSKTVRDASNIPIAVERSFSLEQESNRYNEGGEKVKFVKVVINKLKFDVKARTELQSGQVYSRYYGELKGLTIEFLEILKVTFHTLTFQSRNGQKPDISAEIPDVKFLGRLAFLKKLQDLIPIGGFAGPKCVNVTREGISAEYSIGLPPARFGIFNIYNLSLGARVWLPFNGDPFSVGFNFASREKPFLITAGPYEGGGYFAVVCTSAGIQKLEVGIEFGAHLSLDIIIASGGVQAKGGILYSVIRNADEEDELLFTAYIILEGHLEVWGWFGVSVEFDLSLDYYKSNGKFRLWGEASLEVEVDFGICSYGVTLHVEREMGSCEQPCFGDLLSEKYFYTILNAFSE